MALRLARVIGGTWNPVPGTETDTGRVADRMYASVLEHAGTLVAGKGIGKEDKDAQRYVQQAHER